ncbi:MAG: glycosyltransferase [Bacteroidales bacterium]
MIDFDEEFYLQTNPDVERLVSIGLFDCGFTHYCLNGKYENRLWSNSLISKNFNLKAHYPDGMVKPVNIRPKLRYEPIDKPLKKSTEPYLLILFGHLQRSLFYAGYRAFFRDFDAVFPMFDKIVLSVEFDPIETELATQYCNRIEVIGQKDLYDTEIMPDLIICFSNHLFAKALKLFNRPQRMIYYCQEYEAGFFPFGIEFIEAEKAVAYSQNLIVSTVVLRDFLAGKGLLNATRIFVSSPEIETFDVKPGSSRKLFFYFRPEYFHTRNLPEIIWEAVHEFCNKNHNYDLYLVGTIDTSFSFHLNGNRIYVLSKLPNDAYIELISSCEAVVSMIYSAHPGVVAYQAAASGIPTVTNVFENRNAAYLRQMSENIVPYDPVTDSLAEKIEEAMLMPKGRKSFRNELYAGNDQAPLTGFIFEILNQDENNTLE